MHGLVVKTQSGFFWVQTGEQELVCQLRGRLKKGGRRGDIVAIGDRVAVTRLEDGSGVIEEVLPRVRVFHRLDPSPEGLYEQILIANPDQALLVFACSHPEPRLAMLDRFLVICERQGIPAAIVANKVDLIGMQAAQQLFGHYPGLGYAVVYTSVVDGQGLDDLHRRLSGQMSLLAGPSGVGKSSLLNAIQPGLGQLTRQISRSTRKGRHTTVVRQLFPLLDGGYVADTPGLKALGLWDIQPEELDAYFPELRELVAQCAFSDCTHVHEPGCAVRQAVAAGAVHPDRYRSYVKIRFGEEE
ncbi:MAG: ribosome small subunit-dependent GTPase A [Chloroflexota bacterium]